MHSTATATATATAVNEVADEAIDIRQLLSRPLPELQTLLSSMKMELKATKFDDTYIIKFHPNLEYDPRYAHLKGLIFYHPTATVLSLTYPIPCNVKNSKDIPMAVSKRSKDQVIWQPLKDGTLIRLTYFKTLGVPDINDPSKNWVLSTNSCVNAAEAFWFDKNKTFNVLFTEALQACDVKIDYSVLDSRYVYLFWLQHPDNQIVCPIKQPQVYLVGIMSHVTYREDFSHYGKPVKGLDNIQWYPRLADNQIPTIEQAVEIVNRDTSNIDVDGPVTFAGYMLIDTITGQRYRFEDALYQYARMLLGPCNWISITIINHLINNNPKHMEDFVKFFPHLKSVVESVQNRIDEFVDDLYKYYIKKYIHKNPYFTPPNHTCITLKNVQYYWYLNLKEHRKRVSKEVIRQHLLRLAPRQLNRLLENHRSYKEKLKQSEQPTINNPNQNKKTRKRKRNKNKNKNKTK